jgi:hypothetical protein
MISYCVIIGLQSSSFVDDDGFGILGPETLPVAEADAVELERRRLLFWSAFMAERQLSRFLIPANVISIVSYTDLS